MNSSNVVKCASCNVVINEVLTFVCNKLDIMDEESLSRICISAFSDSDITEAKNLLFEAITTTSKRKINRKRDGKKIREIEDIISLLQVTRIDDRPVFVANELQKLPPVLFDHIDVTKLLKDLTKMRSEIKEIKSQYVTASQIELIKRDIADLKTLTCIRSPRYSHVNAKRGDGTHMMDSCDDDSGPMGLQHVPIASKDTSDESLISNKGENKEENTSPPTRYSSISTNQATYSKTINNHSRNECETGLGSPLHTDDNTESEQATQKSINNIVICPRHTAAAIVQSTSEPQTKTVAQIVSKGEWTVVQKKRTRNRFVGNIGKAVIEPQGKLKAADEKVVLYIYHVDKQVTQSDIIEYIHNNAKIRVDIEKMKMKVSKGYDAYKIFVPKNKFGMFMKDDFWPEGISYRKFIDFSKKKIDRENALKMKNNKNLNG